MPDIAYLDRGQGKAVVLLPGFCETKEMWDGFQKGLSENYRVLCPDLPGFGESTLPRSHFGIRDISSMLLGWMKGLDIHSPVVIGHSLGGYIALGMVEVDPGVLAGVGLFHSTAFADTEEKREIRNKTLVFLEKHGTAAFVRSFIPPLFAENNQQPLSDQIDLLTQRGSAAPVETLIAYTKAMRDRSDRMKVLDAFSGKKFLIAGKQDPAVPLEASRKHEQVVDDYLELEWAGHMGMFEEENTTVNFVNNFLKKVY